MPGFPLAAIGAGLGMFAQQYAQQKAAQERQQMLAITLAKFQQEQKDRQGQNELANIDFGNLGGGGQGFQPVGGPSGGMPFAPSMPGGASSVGTSGGDPLSLIAKYESGGRNIKNPTSSASGPWQFINSTWREMAPKEGVDITQYPTAMSAPVDVQKRVAQRLYNEQGYSPWAPYNSRLAAAIGGGAGAGGGGMAAPRTQMASADPQTMTDAQQPTAGTVGAGGYRYDIGSDEARAAIGQGGGGSERPMTAADTERANQMVQAGPQTATDAGPQDSLQAAIAKIPMPSVPNLNIDAVRQRINQRAPNAPWQDKERMLQNYIAQHGPEATREYQQQMEQYKVQVGVAEKEWAERNKRQDQKSAQQNKGYTLLTDPKTGQSMWVKPGEPSLSVDAPAGATKVGAARPGVELGAELQFPEKWEGMPNKAPPGVRQDVWAATVEYVRTGKMPSLGFQPGMRNLVITATPAAQHALGLTATSTPDVQAQYAGERHGMIVGGGRAAQIGFGIEEAKKAAPQVVETSKGVPRTEFPAANRFTNWLQEQAGSPQTVAFREALNTYLNIYAATVSRTGRLTDSQQNHAYELLSTAFNQGQIERGIQQLDYEMSLMREAVGPAMEGITPIGQPPAMRKPETPATPPQGAAGSAYKSPDDVLRAIDSGSLTPEAGKKIIIDQFGYTPKAAQ
jgi:hypothetical protein